MPFTRRTFNTQPLLDTRRRYTQAHLHTGALARRRFHTHPRLYPQQLLLTAHLSTQKTLFIHTRHTHTHFLVHKRFYMLSHTAAFIYRFFHTDALALPRFYAQMLLHQTLLHTEMLKHKRFDTTKLEQGTSQCYFV